MPTAAFVIAILVFLAGWRLYTILPPQGSPLARMWRVLRGAWRNRALALPADASELYDGDGGKDDAAAPLVVADGDDDHEAAASGGRKFCGCGTKPRRLELTERMPHTEGMAFLDKAAIRPSSSPPPPAAPRPRPAARSVTVSIVEESKAFYRIMPIFALVVIYQMTYDPIFTLLPYPGDVMDRRIGGGGAVIPASSISFANTFGGERAVGGKRGGGGRARARAGHAALGVCPAVLCRPGGLEERALSCCARAKTAGGHSPPRPTAAAKRAPARPQPPQKKKTKKPHPKPNTWGTQCCSQSRCTTFSSFRSWCASAARSP